MATRSRILAWRIPCTLDPGGLSDEHFRCSHTGQATVQSLVFSILFLCLEFAFLFPQALSQLHLTHYIKSCLQKPVTVSNTSFFKKMFG